jgi:hypothetical protein
MGHRRPCRNDCCPHECTILDDQFEDSAKLNWTDRIGTWSEGFGSMSTSDSNALITCDKKAYTSNYHIYTLMKSATGNESRIIFDYIDEYNYSYVSVEWDGADSYIYYKRVIGDENDTDTTEVASAGPFNFTDSTWTEGTLCLLGKTWRLTFIVTSPYADTGVIDTYYARMRPRVPQRVGLGTGTTTGQMDFDRFVFSRHLFSMKDCPVCTLPEGPEYCEAIGGNLTECPDLLQNSLYVDLSACDIHAGTALAVCDDEECGGLAAEYVLTWQLALDCNVQPGFVCAYDHQAPEWANRISGNGFPHCSWGFQSSQWCITPAVFDQDHLLVLASLTYNTFQLHCAIVLPDAPATTPYYYSLQGWAGYYSEGAEYQGGVMLFEYHSEEYEDGDCGACFDDTGTITLTKYWVIGETTGEGAPCHFTNMPETLALTRVAE